jgi:hypothetical protein
MGRIFSTTGFSLSRFDVFIDAAQIKGRQAEACPTGENDEHSGAGQN